MNALTDDQWQQYERDGYLKLGRLLSDSELAALQQRIDELGLQDCFTLVGSIPPDDMATWYHLGDAFLFASKSETQGMVILEAMSAGLPVVVAGCVPQADPDGGVWSGHSAVGVEQIDAIVDVVDATLAGKVVRRLGRRSGPAGDSRPRLALPKIRRNALIEIVPINTGCLNACTYCKTKGARGRLASYHPLDIIDRVRHVVEAEGVKEIRLTSEDTGAYGRDIGTSLPELLRGVLAAVEDHDDVMVKLGMTNPPYILDHLEAMGEIFGHKNMYQFIHVPVQAGANRVLDAMKREYTVEQFEHVCRTLRAAAPDIMIATDVICGFPTETEAEFDATCALVDGFRFPVVNISQFYPRPGTPAAKMRKVRSQEVKARSRKISALFRSYATFDELVGEEVDVWITEMAADGHSLVGHTRAYVQVLLSPDDYQLGTRDVARIVSASKWSVCGERPAPAPAHVATRTVWQLVWLAVALLVAALAWLLGRD